MLVEEHLGINSSRVDVVLSDLSARRVAVPEPTLVCAYLAQHPDLLDIMPIALAAVGAQFPSDSQFSLEVYRDPEIDDEYLALYVRQPIYTDDFLERLHEVYGAYAATLNDKSGWLQVTTDFAPPDH